MATIKSFTDISQSKVLAEILPLESADMYYWCADHYPKENWIIEVGSPDDNYECICAWSLAALLGVLPEIDGRPLNIERVKAEDGYNGYYYHIEYKDKILIPYSKNPVDACVAMVEKLNELNLL